MALTPVHFRGIVLGPSGFAAQGREWLAALEACGRRPSLEGARLGEFDTPLSDAERALIERCAERPRRAGGITVHHMLIPHFAPDPNAESNVLITLFETADLPPVWAEHLDRADLVITPSAWNRDVFRAAGVSRTEAIAQPFLAGPFDPDRSPRTRPTWTADACVRWLTVFDWSPRKAPEVLLRAFACAFDTDQAELVVKVAPDPRRTTAAVQAECEAQLQLWSARPPRVTVDDRLLDRAGLARLFADADAFVLASRGEGWGRPVHEALLLGLPVVAPHHSALAELLPNTEFGFPVAARLAPVSRAASDAAPWFRGRQWYEPDVGSLVEQLRAVRSDPVAARQRAAAGRQRILAHCDPARSAARLNAAIDGITARQRAPARR